jgi:hypothetical protein
MMATVDMSRIVKADRSRAGFILREGFRVLEVLRVGHLPLK